MNKSVVIKILVFFVLVISSCSKDDTNEKDPESIKPVDYTIIGDTNILIADFKQINTKLEGNKIGDIYNYSYFDSLSLDLNNDSINDLTFNYYAHISKLEGCTCLPRAKINVWITPKYKVAIICDSVKNTAIGYVKRDSVNIKNDKWCSEDSISIFSLNEFEITHNSLIDWTNKNYICFKTTDKKGINQIGWIKIALIENYFLLVEYSISRK